MSGSRVCARARRAPMSAGATLDSSLACEQRPGGKKKQTKRGQAADRRKRGEARRAQRGTRGRG
eukprot:1276258-Lingulodinium_polyedra.AAC.1